MAVFIIKRLEAHSPWAPASIWQWPSIQALLGHEGVVTGTFRQDKWNMPYRMPTRPLARLPGFEVLALGMPEFGEQDGIGPLGRLQHLHLH